MKRICLAACLAVIPLLGACDHQGIIPGADSGHALLENGPQAIGVLGIPDTRVGDDLMFALPAFDNGSKSELTIKSVRIKNLADGLRIVDYRTLSYDDTDGMLLGWVKRTAPKDEANLLSVSRPGVAGIAVPAKSLADRYALVHVKVEAPPTGATTEGVEVVYEQNGQSYTQDMQGKWRLKAND